MLLNCLIWMSFAPHSQNDSIQTAHRSWSHWVILGLVVGTTHLYCHQSYYPIKLPCKEKGFLCAVTLFNPSGTSIVSEDPIFYNQLKLRLRAWPSLKGVSTGGDVSNKQWLSGWYLCEGGKPKCLWMGCSIYLCGSLQGTWCHLVPDLETGQVSYSASPSQMANANRTHWIITPPNHLLLSCFPSMQWQNGLSCSQKNGTWWHPQWFEQYKHFTAKIAACMWHS